MYKISIIVVLFLFCLAPQAKAGDITIKNERMAGICQDEPS